MSMSRELRNQAATA